MPARAAIGLGSNLGDRRRHIAEAIAALRELGRLVGVSAIYETAPIGGPEQDAYLNAVVVIDTDLSPEQLLDECLQIERAHGRQRRERWGPRTLDLDILLYGDRAIAAPGLTVPHPRLAERRFVLEPLVEVWPDAGLPDGTRAASLLPAVADQKVRRVGQPASGRSVSVAAVAFTVVAALVIWWLFDLVL